MNKGDRVYNKYSTKYGVITAVLPEKGAYRYWVEYEDSDNNEWYSENEISLVQPGTDEQTIMFWNLQLQFMARSSDSLLDVYEGLRFGGMYKNNKYTQKMEQLRHRYGHLFTEEEHNCLATHLALQLSGLE